MGLLTLVIFIVVMGFFVVLLLPRFLQEASAEKIKYFKKRINLTVIGVVVLILFLKSVTIVSPGEVGIQVLFGNVLKRTLENGMHLINPFCDIMKMNVRLQEYTMSIASEEGEYKGDDSIDALTSEGLKIKLDLTCWYMLNPKKAQEVYRTIGMDYRIKVIRPVLRTAIRDVVSRYMAKEVYSTERENIVITIEEKIKPVMGKKGFIFEKLLLRNVVLPEKLATAIDEKLSAEQEAKRMEFVLQKEEKEKDRKVIEAKGIREANRIISQGLTPNYINWYRIEMMKQLVNSPNNTIIFIPEKLRSAPALINIPAASGK